MSFILDALRKSDQQRQRSMTPSLMIAPAPVETPRQSAFLWYGLLAAILIGAGILLGMMHRWQEEPSIPAISANPSEADRPIVPGSNTFTSTPAPLAIAPAPANKSGNSSPSSLTLRQSASVSATDPTSQQATVSASSTMAVPVAVHKELPHTTSTEVGQESPATSVMDLPSALQQEIPKLVILIHAYSDTPKSRFILINDRKWHEEDYPAAGLKLEQITPDGVIFSYKGYRFRRGINP
ncbi:MAG TPA: general secretion pathway protein GspB [Rhodocyclaceae bacterium]|nr:general secretion pathway protein GspB [Rhodocyclaceae bacterium]